MNKRVSLVFPRIVSGWQAHPRMAIPMNLLCMATQVDREGYQVQFIDQRTEPNWRLIMTKELEQAPVCVAISAKTGTQLHHALEVAKVIKKNGNVPVVWCGIHPSLCPEQTLQNDNCDIVIQGEEEETFLKLVKALEQKRPLSSVKGIWFKENGHIETTGIRPFVDLNKQPPLSYHVLDLKQYCRTMFGVEHLNFATSRGCPHACTYCFENTVCRRTWRSMDADLAVQRIKDFVQQYHVKGLTISDVNFFTDMDRGRKILEGIIQENLNLYISKINIRLDTISVMNDNDFKLLERVGCKRLIIGVESGSEKIQRLMKKPVNIPRLLEINRKLKQFSIVPIYFFMMGFPTETKEDLAQTVSLSLELLEGNPNAVRTFNIFTPFPGTELFDFAVKYGLSVPRKIEDWIPFNYRNYKKNSPWLSKEMLNFMEMLDFCTSFIGKSNFLHPYEKTNPLVTFISNLYAPMAMKRVQKSFYQFLVEVKLAKLLKFYAKQN